MPGKIPEYMVPLNRPTVPAAVLTMHGMVAIIYDEAHHICA